jgi:hypothetical protein
VASIVFVVIVFIRVFFVALQRPQINNRLFARGQKSIGQPDHILESTTLIEEANSAVGLVLNGVVPDEDEILGWLVDPLF